ncbi:hypothetical protein [Marinigracilibium pacificum]|uniref:Uncharacterized protein n=1 Tax=Marinigracilibium pacificum TaxID=2729599 RepID=A0A848J349_9BACT|nr:hypothetical protein [Marinigracilibium pacificum]NMM48914.1 hypothetical protein [Marinigracilibium pacificum]
MKHKGIFFLLFSLTVVAVIAFWSDTVYAVYGLYTFILVVLGISIYGILKQKKESKYPYRMLLILLSCSSVLILIFSRLILIKYWIGFWELSNYLFVVSTVLFISFIIVLILSAVKSKNINIYNSSDILLLITPLILFSLLELFHFKNSVSKESIERLENLRVFTEFDLSNIVIKDKNPSFIEVYDLIEEIEIKLIEQSGGVNKYGEVVNSNNDNVPNKIVLNSGYLDELDFKITTLYVLIESIDQVEKLKRIKNYLLNDNIQDNSVTEMLYRLSLLKLQLKNIELETYVTQHPL